jgi:hypothetical protein
MMGGVLSGLLLVAMVPGVASAGSHGSACPKGGGWELVPAGLVTEFDVGNAADQNGDGAVCVRINPGKTRTDPSGSELWTVKDNTN